MDGKWHFPSDIGVTEKNEECDAVYSFLLDSVHSMLIGGIECCTLGHGMSEEVVAHPYLGTERVIDDLMNMRGFEQGIIEFYDGCMVREAGSEIITGWDTSKLVPAH